MSRPVSTLVYGDLRGAGHELLSRSDLDLRWALTLHEALSVSRQLALELVIASDQFALSYLEARTGLPRKAPCIVLGGPELAAKKDALDRAGATAFVLADDPRRLMEAISELTGLTFRDHPRVALETVVDVQMRGESSLLYTFDLSVSGVSIKSLSNARYGDRATLTFDLFDPPLTASAIVVRHFNVPEEQCVGFRFVDLEDADRARVAEVVDRELAGLPLFSTSDIEDAPGEQTIDLLAALRAKGDAGLSDYVRMVSAIVDGWDDADSAPTWVFEVAGKLTDTERKALSSGAPAWAKAAVEMRIDLKRQIVDRGSAGQFAHALELCRTMANDVDGATEEEAVDATAIRSALLRSIYVLHRTIKERMARHAAKRSLSPPERVRD
jgi:hypothetical protein